METVCETYIRWMIRRDVSEVLLIDSMGFEEQWEEEDLINHLRQRNNIGMVIENTKDSMILGYMVYQLQKTQLELVRLAVHPYFSRRKIGSKFIDKLKGKLSSNRRRSLVTTCDTSNLGGMLFLKHHEFRATECVNETIKFVYTHRGLNDI